VSIELSEKATKPRAPPTRWWKLRERLGAKWAELMAEQATPERLGVAVGVGVLMGCSPFHGFQFLIALALAWLLKLNKIAVMIGLQISAPPITPFVALAGIQLGEYMLHQRFLPLSISEIRAMSGGSLLRTVLVDMTVGGLTLGAVLGLALGGLTTWVLRRRRART
jgi:uncharacterized protein (DUF2062 family)